MSDTPVVNADVSLDASPSILSRAIAEVFGTFVLVFGVIGAALFFAPQWGPLPVALAIGFTIIGAAYAIGHISGGHFNPAVTLGAAAAGRFAWKDVLPYIVAQFVGGILASSVLLAIRSGIGDTDNVNTFTAVSNGWGDLSGLHASFIAVAVTELVITALFLWIILGVTDRRAPSGFAPIAIGIALMLFHLVAIPISNASLNPARSLATAIYGGPDAIAQVWLFFVAPIVGALIAGFTYKPLFDRK